MFHLLGLISLFVYFWKLKLRICHSTIYMKIRNLIILIILVSLGGIIVYRIKTNQSQEAKGKDKGGARPPAQVEAMIIQPEIYKDQLSLTGSITANEQAEIRSEVSGIVQNIYFQEGSFVSKDQILLKVVDAELQAQLGQSKTKESLALENERRAKLLLQKEGISQEEYDITRAELITAQAQTQVIQAQLAKSIIKAPFAGKIGLRNISTGSYITPSVLIANLVNTSKVKITFSIPEKYANSIKMGTSIQFNTSSTQSNSLAKIYAIEPEIDINTRTLLVRAIAENSNGSLMPGTFANIILPLQTIPDAIIIPSESVIPIQGGKKVFIAENGNAKEVKVETSTRTDASILIIKGLNKGDTLITSGIMSLKDKAPIKIKLK